MDTMDQLDDVQELTFRCARCQQSKSASAFYMWRSKKRKAPSRQSYCKPCQAAYTREWIFTHPNRAEWKRAHKVSIELRRATESRRKARYRALRLEMIAAYGGKCACCGIQEFEFLTLEHLNGGGRKHYRRLGKAGRIYAELKALGWPKDAYTCLCFNCNSAKGAFGVCPHERKRLQLVG